MRRQPPGPLTDALVLARELADEMTGSGVWTLQLTTGRVAWSRQLYRLHELDPDVTFEPDLEYILSLVHPDDRGAMEEAVTAARDGNVTKEYRYRVVLPSGRVIHFEARVVRQVGGEEAPILVGAVRDVTAEHQARLGLRLHVAVSDAIAAWRGFPDGAERLLASLGRELGMTRGLLWAPEDGTLKPRATWGELPAEQRPVRQLAAGQGLAGRAWLTRLPVLSADISAEPGYEYRETALEAGIVGALALPAVHADTVHVVILLAGPHRLEFDDAFLDMLVSLSHRLGAFFGRRLGELTAPVLSPRETQVLQLAADGHPGPEIARLLFLSQATVKTHFENIYAKYEVSDRVAAVARGMREGIIV